MNHQDITAALAHGFADQLVLPKGFSAKVEHEDEQEDSYTVQVRSKRRKSPIVWSCIVDGESAFIAEFLGDPPPRRHTLDDPGLVDALNKSAHDTLQIVARSETAIAWYTKSALRDSNQRTMAAGKAVATAFARGLIPPDGTKITVERSKDEYAAVMRPEGDDSSFGKYWRVSLDGYYVAVVCRHGVMNEEYPIYEPDTIYEVQRSLDASHRLWKATDGAHRGFSLNGFVCNLPTPTSASTPA